MAGYHPFLSACMQHEALTQGGPVDCKAISSNSWQAYACLDLSCLSMTRSQMCHEYPSSWCPMQVARLEFAKQMLLCQCQPAATGLPG